MAVKLVSAAKRLRGATSGIAKAIPKVTTATASPNTTPAATETAAPAPYVPLSADEMANAWRNDPNAANQMGQLDEDFQRQMGGAGVQGSLQNMYTSQVAGLHSKIPGLMQGFDDSIRGITSDTAARGFRDSGMANVDRSRARSNLDTGMQDLGRSWQDAIGQLYGGIQDATTAHTRGTNTVRTGAANQAVNDRMLLQTSAPDFTAAARRRKP
jgi:hypothetical protein